MKSGMSIVSDKLGKFQKSLSALMVAKVLVGVPAKNAERDDENDEPGPINNAAIGYLMENGSPEKNIPARPFLIPGVKDAQKQIAEVLQGGTINALSGNEAGFTRSLKEAGQIAASSVQNKIDSGPFAPLSDRTLRERARKQVVSGGTKADRESAKEALKSGDYSDVNAKPLIDTGQLLRSISFIIRK